MQTIAQQLGIKKFPFEIKDDNGNVIYWETSDGFWSKREFDEKGNLIYYEEFDGYWLKQEFDEKSNQIYYEDSKGEVIDNRPKCENKVVEVTMAQQTAVSQLIEQLRQLAHNPKTHLGMGDIRVTQGYLDELEQGLNQVFEKQILDAICANQNGLLRRKTVLEAMEYYNQTFGDREVLNTSPNTQNK